MRRYFLIKRVSILYIAKVTRRRRKKKSQKIKTKFSIRISNSILAIKKIRQSNIRRRRKKTLYINKYIKTLDRIWLESESEREKIKWCNIKYIYTMYEN